MTSRARDDGAEAAASTELRLAETAHELANLVTSIASGVDVALRLSGTHQQRAILEDVQHAISHLIVVMRRLRAPEGEHLVMGEVDPRAAVEGALRLAEPRLGPRTIIEQRHGVAPAVRADEPLLEQALLNLILNAIEAFSPASTEVNRIRLATGTDASGHAVIEVEDDGPGIPEDTCARIFELHYTTKPGGSGFGLPLCRRAIVAMGGTISVESRPGRTSFAIRLPPAID